MRKFLFTFLFFFLLIAACQNKQSKFQTGEQTVDNNSVKSVRDLLLDELDTTEIYNDSILCGYWFQPHAAGVINIFFHKDNSYEFKYCENRNDNEVIDKLKKGKYTINGDVITLTSEDGWDDYFNGVMYYKNNGTNYYLTSQKGIFYLVKGSN